MSSMHVYAILRWISESSHRVDLEREDARRGAANFHVHGQQHALIARRMRVPATQPQATSASKRTHRECVRALARPRKAASTSEALFDCVAADLRKRRRSAPIRNDAHVRAHRFETQACGSARARA
eukprot:2089161-Pleurochrysis_carterae.AAC.2